MADFELFAKAPRIWKKSKIGHFGEYCWSIRCLFEPFFTLNNSNVVVVILGMS